MSSRIQHLTHDGLTLDVRDEGPLDGDVVVLLHGFPQDSGCWDAVAPRLHAAGLRTLAPDQRGYSPAAAPRGVAAYRMPHLVGDVLALLDAVDADSVHLVGHDWGGAVAWATALAAPERLHTLTVLSTPHPAALRRALRTPDQLRKSWYMGAFQVPRLPEIVLSRAMARFLTDAGLPPAQVERYARRFATPASLRGPIDWYRALVPPLRRGGSRQSMLQPGHSPIVRVPTTFVWGRHDEALGRTGAEATRTFVAAPFEFVELDAGHWLPEMNPDEVGRAILARCGA